MIRALAVAGVLIVTAGIGLPGMACAQAGSPQAGSQGGGAVGLLLLLAGGGRRDPAVSKQSPSVRVSDEAKGKNIRVKQERLPAKDGSTTVRVEEVAPRIPDKVASQSKLHQGSIIPVAHYEKNQR